MADNTASATTLSGVGYPPSGGAPFAGPSGNGQNGTGGMDHGGGEPLADYISGVHWADELGVDPETPVAEVLGADTWKALRRYCHRHQIAITYDDGGMAFADFDAVPRSIWLAAHPVVSVTRRAVTEFVSDTLTRDPHDIGAELEQARRARFDERRVAEQALKSGTIPPDRPYTFNEVERVCGPAVAEQVRATVTAGNRDCWNTRKLHHLQERVPLALAGELYSRFGVAVEQLALMVPASVEEVSAAKEALAVARKRHADGIAQQARVSATPPLALDDDVLSFEQLSELAPVVPLIDGLLAAGELVEEIGEPGTGKTFISLGQALCVAAGRNWCGHEVPRAAPVLYVLAEGTSDAEVRAKAFCQQTKITAADLGGRFHLYPRPIQIADEAHVREVRAYVEKHRIEMVVFDTKARCTVGVEENSATEQGRAIDNVETLSRDYRAAVVVVHHTAAGAEKGRGSTAWLGAVWSSLLVTREVKNKKRTGTVKITCAKHKGWPDGCVHKVTLAEVVVSEDAMPGKTLRQRQSAAISAFDVVADNAAQAQTDSEIGDKIKAVFHTYGATTGLTKAEGRRHAQDAGVSNSSYSRYFDRFVKVNVLVPVPGASAHFRLKGDAAASTVGTEENQALVDVLKDRLCELRTAGEITDAHTRNDASNMLGTPDKTAFGQAWGWFEDQGRPTARV